MQFRVLRSFTANGQNLERGVEVDLTPSPRVQDLIAARFLLPIDPKVEAVTKTADNALVDAVVARSKRKGT